MPWTNMGNERQFASVIQINSNQALIIGGQDEYGSPLKSTELISSSGSEEMTDFPVKIVGHCSFKINATHAIVTGGDQDRSISTPNTWYVDLTTTRVTPGPTMKTGRSNHGCSVFQHGTKSYGIISGGWDGSRLDSTEIIDFDQESPSWTEGMQDKFKIHSLSLTKVFFPLIFRSKIPQKIGIFDFGENKARHLCYGWSR